MGLVWDKKKSAFSIGKDADFSEAPVGYWLGMERPVNNESDTEKASKAFARIAKTDLTLTQAIALLQTAYQTDAKVAAQHHTQPMLVHGGLDYGSIRNHATKEVSYVYGVKGPTIAGGYKFAALTSEN